MKQFILSLFLIASLGAARPAKAAIGVSYASFGVSMIGVGMLAVGGAATYGGIKAVSKSTPGRILLGVTLFAVALGAGWYGLLILDGEDQAQPQFTELNSSDAAVLGISENAREVYNSELDQLNAVNTEIASAVEGVDTKTGAEMAAGLWSEYKETLSQETFEVVLKIASQAQ